jgi:malonate decarboxylase delta subunit
LNSPPGSRPKVALVGCVGSGDLEVLIEPGTAGKLTIQVQTSVNGASNAGSTCLSGCSRAHATGDEHRYPRLRRHPGVVRLRLEQGFEEIGHD